MTHIKLSIFDTFNKQVDLIINCKITFIENEYILVLSNDCITNELAVVDMHHIIASI